MWNLTWLTILVIIGLSSSEKFDAINNLLSALKAESTDLKCDQSTEFLETIVPNVNLGMSKPFEKGVFKNEAIEVTLKFTFHYANRNTNTVFIKPNGVLILRNGACDLDFIKSVPEGSVTSNVEYDSTAEYFVAKWTNLIKNTTIYTVSVIIYGTGDIIIAYEQIDGGNSGEVQILNYHKLNLAQQYVYVGPVIQLSDLASHSVVYVKKCDTIDEQSTKLTKTNNPKIIPQSYRTPIEADDVSGPSDAEALEQPNAKTTVDNVIKLQQDINVKPILPNATNLTDNKVNHRHIIPNNYVANSERANNLFNEINNTVSTTDILNAETTIDFSFEFNDVVFKTVSISPKGKIWLTAKTNNQVQVEPIPVSGDLVIDSFVLKYHVNGSQLIIVMQNFHIKTLVTTSKDNIIIVIFRNPGIIEINYKILFNRDIKGRTVVMHTAINNSVNDSSVGEGEVDFTQVQNGTSVIFGEPNNIGDMLNLSDLQNEFKDESVQYLRNDSMLNSYYLINVDNVASTYDNGLATVKSKFALKFKHRSLHNVYITNRMEMYFDTVYRKLKIIPEADNFTNTDFKYTTTPEYTSLTWSNLQTVTDSTANTIYHLRVLIYPSGKIIILFKEIKNGSPSISHEFIPNLMIDEVTSGSMVCITTGQIENLTIYNKSMEHLKSEVASKMVATSPSHISKVINATLVEQFDLATFDLEWIDIYNTKSSQFNLGFQICAVNELNTVHVSERMELFINGNVTLNLLPHDNKFTATSFKKIKTEVFIAIEWQNLKSETQNFSLRVFIYRDGKAFVLYKNIGPTAISNTFSKSSDAITIENGTIVQIDICSIKPILFDDLLSLFPPITEDCSINPVAMLDDEQLETYLTLRPDTTSVPENTTKNITIESQFEIDYGNETKVQTISITDSVLLNVINVATINLAPMDGEEFVIEADFKSTVTTAYITMTWSNLKIKSNESTSRIYKKIRVIVFGSGTILIIYDIDQNGSNVFLPNTNPIELKRGLVVKIDACTLVKLDAVKTFSDLLGEFNGLSRNSLQLNEVDFNHYLTMSQDSTQPKCTDNICKVMSKFNIVYGDVTLTSIDIANYIEISFESETTLNLLATRDVKRIGVEKFNYTATDEYLSISWYNLRVIENDIYDIRLVIYPNGDVIFVYQVIGTNHLIRLTDEMAEDKGIFKKTVNELIEYLAPKSLLAKVKHANQSPVECATLVNDESGKIAKTLFSIKPDIILVDAFETKISMNFTITLDGHLYQDLTLVNQTKFYFDVSNHVFLDITKMVKYPTTLSILYEVTSEYTSITLNNLILINASGNPYKLNGRIVIYSTGDILFGFEHIEGSEPQTVMIYDTVLDISNGKIILIHAPNCKKSAAISVDEQTHDVTTTDTAIEEHMYDITTIGTSFDKPPHDQPLIASANRKYGSHLARLVLAVSLIVFSVNYL